MYKKFKILSLTNNLSVVNSTKNNSTKGYPLFILSFLNKSMKFLSDSKLLHRQSSFSTTDLLISHASLSILPAICKSDGSIFEYLRVSRHLDSTIVNYFEQMYAPFVVLRFSLDRMLANCL